MERLPEIQERVEVVVPADRMVQELEQQAVAQLLAIMGVRAAAEMVEVRRALQEPRLMAERAEIIKGALEAVLVRRQLRHQVQTALLGVAAEVDLAGLRALLEEMVVQVQIMPMDQVEEVVALVEAQRQLSVLMQERVVQERSMVEVGVEEGHRPRSD